MQIQKSYLYAAGGLAAAAALVAGLMMWSSYRKPGKVEVTEAQGFYKPRGIALAADGSLFIVDSRNNRIVKHRADGTLEKRFGRAGVKDGEFREPCDVKVGKDGNLYVADTFHTLDAGGGLPWGRIQKLSPDGAFISSWGRVNIAPNDLFGPRAIALDNRNFVYLSDTGNHRIIKYDLNGSFVKAWGSNGKGQGQFTEPFGIAVSNKDEVYVVDRMNFRVQVFDDEGTYLREFKVETGDKEQINREPYIALDNKRGYCWISDPAKGRILRYGMSGGLQKAYDTAVEGKLKQPTGLAVRESDGLVYVSDGELAKIMTVKP